MTDITSADIFKFVEKQREIVRMLAARDEMNGAVHMTPTRWSPVTEASRDVCDFLVALYSAMSSDEEDRELEQELAADRDPLNFLDIPEVRVV